MISAASISTLTPIFHCNATKAKMQNKMYTILYKYSINGIPSLNKCDLL